MVALPRHIGAIAARMDMDGMDMGTGTGTGTGSSDDNSTTSAATSSMMAMTFTNDMTATLYSARWAPSSTGTYAGTCIFLIALAVVFRGLFALRALQEDRWLDRALDRRYVVVVGEGGGPAAARRDSSLEKQQQRKSMMLLSANGVEEEVMVVSKRRAHVGPWRLSVDPLRAVVDTVIAGVGYLL